MEPNWKKFEQLVAVIQAELAPDATVKPNTRLPGRKSQTQRQIDILIEREVGQFNLRIAIDCKDHNRPIDVKDVEEVIGLVDDVGANKGAIVAAKGFTEAAKRRGAEAGLDLYRLVDTAKHKWGGYVTIPVVMRDWQLGEYRFRFQFTGRGAIPLQDIQHLPIYRRDGSLIDYASNLILDRWDKNEIPKVAGEHLDLPLVHEPTFLKGSLGLFEAKILFCVFVQEVLHFGQLPIEEMRGFKDEVSGGVITKGFTTQKFAFERIGREWPRINSVDQLAVRPMAIFTVCSTYPRYKPAPIDAPCCRHGDHPP